MVTPCGQLFKASLPLDKKGECVIERRIDWLYRVEEKKKERAKTKMKSIPESDVIDEYFTIEDLPLAKTESVRHKADVKRAKTFVADSVIDIDDYSVYEKPEILEKPKQKIVEAKEWVIIS